MYHQAPKPATEERKNEAEMSARQTRKDIANMSFLTMKELKLLDECETEEDLLAWINQVTYDSLSEEQKSEIARHEDRAEVDF